MTLYLNEDHLKVTEQVFANQDSDESALQEAFATAAWSLICEPGDRLAGFLISTLGATKALALEITEATPVQYSKEIEAAAALELANSEFVNFSRSISEARLRWRPRLNQTAVLDSLCALQRARGKFVTPQSDFWPTVLNDLGFGSPRALWVRGDVNHLRHLDRSIALVGSRNSTSYGEYITTELVSGLVERRVAVVSGGAYGIDATAHKATLALGGLTVAVLAGGCDRLYPAANQKLLERVIETGLVISELPPASTPTKWRFLQRNRVIAAISSATVVVEAGLPSGALSTANHAIYLDRALGAVPGSIVSRSSLGCHALIQEGKAQLVTSLEDVLALIEVGQIGFAQSELDGLGVLETRTLDAFGSRPLELSEICSAAGLTSSEAQLALGSLELLGLVARTNGLFSKLR